MVTDSERGGPRTVPAFDPADERYTACCRGCHVKTASLVVGFVELLWCVVQLFGLIYNWWISGSSSYIIWFLIGLLGIIMLVIVVGMLFYGIKIQNAFWVAPHLFCQVFLIILVFVAAIVVFFLLVFGQHTGILNLVGMPSSYQMKLSHHAKIWVGIGLIIFYLVVGLLEVWFFLIVYKLYRYLRDEEVAVNDRTRFFVTTPAATASDDFYAPSYNQWETSDMHHTTSPSFHPGSPEAGDIYPYGTIKTH